MKKLKALILFSVLYYTGIAAQVQSPKFETRAVWLTTLGGLDWPTTYANSIKSAEKQKKELTDILDKLQDAGINSVLFQVRTRSALIYPSGIEPWAQCLTGRFDKNPGYDPLEFAINECHRRGIELHAWITTIPAGRWNSKECRLLRQKLPGVVKRTGDQGYMDPGNANTGSYLSDICREIASLYDVDGIHLDYIRYPENVRTGVSPSKARQNITSIVRRIYNDVKSIKPWIKISCSPIGKYSDLARYSSKGWNARDKVFQDAQAWLKEGIMDMIFPMMYFRGNNYYPFLIDWLDNSCGGTVVSGLGAYMLSPREMNWKLIDITRQMHVSRQYGAGYALFRSKFFTDDVKGIYSYTKNILNLHPALPNAIKCRGTKKPEAPATLDVRYSGSYYIISWSEGKWHDTSDYCMYNLYASHTFPVDTSNPMNLIRCRKTDREAAIKRGGKPVYFAVTTYDRYGRESEARQQQDYAEIKGNSKMMECTGNTMALHTEADDTEFIVIESLQGNIIAILPYDHNEISTKNIPCGIYTLRTLNKRGVSHRIGIMNKKWQ